MVFPRFRESATIVKFPPKVLASLRAPPSLLPTRRWCQGCGGTPSAGGVHTRGPARHFVRATKSVSHHPPLLMRKIWEGKALNLPHRSETCPAHAPFSAASISVRTSGSACRKVGVQKKKRQKPEQEQKNPAGSSQSNVPKDPGGMFIDMAVCLVACLGRWVFHSRVCNPPGNKNGID